VSVVTEQKETCWLTSAQARELIASVAAPVTDTTLRTWLARNWIRGLKVGPRRYLFDRDSLLAMIQPVGALNGEERAAIAELVANSPDPTDEQIAKVRSIIHGASAG
jgi:hypothetical protein